MAQNNGINIQVNAKDNSTSVLNNIGNSVRNMFSSVSQGSSAMSNEMSRVSQQMQYSMTGATRSMSTGFTNMANNFSTIAQNMNNSVSELGNNIKDLGSQLTRTATLAFTATAGLGVKAAAEMEELDTKMEQVFKEMHEPAMEYSRELSNTLGRSEKEIKTFLAQNQNLFYGFSGSREAAFELSKSVVELGFNLAALNDWDDAETINLLTSALMGQSMAAKSLGASTLEADLAETMRLEGMKGSFLQLTQTEKIMVRYQTILRQSTDTTGYAAREAGMFTSTLKNLKGNFYELTGVLMSSFLPALNELGKILLDAISWVKGLSEGQQRFIVLVGAVIAAIGPLLSILGNFIIVMNAVQTAAVTMNVSMAAILGPIALIGLAIGGLILLVPVLIEHWDKITEFFKNLFEGIVSGFKSLVGFMADVGKALVSALLFPFTGVIDVITGLFGMSNPLRMETSLTSPTIPKYSDGANVINAPSGGKLSILHDGEAVIPAKENPYNPSYNGRSLGGSGETIIEAHIHIGSHEIVKEIAPDLVREIKRRGGI